MIKIQHIRTKLLLLLFASALLCLGLFHTLWANKWYVLHVITETNLPIMLPVPQPDENFWTMLGTEALNYDIPDSESDTEAVEKLQSLFDRLDDYTGLYVYGLEDGIYRELIAALSHDLRTPLTVLHGYLDILQLDRNPDMQNTYVTRCLQKTDDIRRLTDRMFEYALVYDVSEPEQIRMIPFSLSRLLGLFREQMDFLELAGFHTDISFPDADTSDITTPDALTIQADPELCKRILNNLFSNILKYGSKQETVTLSMQLPPEINKDAALCLALKNTVKPEHSAVESNRIGLKSSTRNMERMGGKLVVFQTNTFFEVTLSFPVTAP